MTGPVEAVWKELERPFQTAAGLIHYHRSNRMAALSDAQAAFQAYVDAVNQKLAALAAAPAVEDLQPLVDEIAAAQAALNPSES